MKILGIDTSAYTTSVAMVDTEKEMIMSMDTRRVLDVPMGKRGLRQSDAVFQHIQKLPELLSSFVVENVDAVAVSTAPRAQADSYMPVFTVGHAFAQTIAATKGIPLYACSHQEGHLMAGLWSSKFEPDDAPFLGIHISGGTSDVMSVKMAKQHLDITPLGASQDLHAGQFVDRVGVSLGASFPAGAIMDQWAQSVITPPTWRIPSYTQKYDMSFSGPTTAALRKVAEEIPAGEVALAVFLCIARTLEKVIRYALQKKSYRGVLIVGGVASNTHLRRRLEQRLDIPLFYASPSYSTDNAVGTALLGLKQHKENQED